MSLLPDKKPLVSYTQQLRSRYSETDKMGYIYYGHYLQYFEVARTEFIRSAGIPYREMEDSGIMLPVVHAELDYKKPVLYDEVMNITVHIYEYPKVRLITYYDIKTDNNRILNVTGRVELCFIDARTRRPVRAPEEFNKGIQNFIATQV